MRRIVTILILLTLGPTWIQAQTVGLRYWSEHNFSIPPPYSPFELVVEVTADVSLKRATVFLDLPQEFISLESLPDDCYECNLQIHGESHSATITFPTCSPIDYRTYVTLRFITLEDVSGITGSLCIDAGESTYMACDGTSGNVSTLAEYSCSREIQPRCLWINALEPCGLPTIKTGWGPLKARWGSSG